MENSDQVMEKTESRLAAEVPEDELRRIVEGIVAKVRPGVEAHGGTVELVDVSAGEVKIKLSGACSSCMYSAGTLAAFARLLKREAPAGLKLVMLR